MRRVILQQFVTIDGFAADQDDQTGFINTYVDEDDKSFQQDAGAFLDTIDTMVLGADTYRLFAGYWPEAQEEGEFARKLNSLSKYVVTSTLDDAPWGNWEPATVIGSSGDVATLKEQAGRDIVVWGSLTLATALMKAGLIDEWQLRVVPVILGAGRPLLTEGVGEVGMDLIEAKPYGAGMVLLRYRSASTAED